MTKRAVILSAAKNPPVRCHSERAQRAEESYPSDGGILRLRRHQRLPPTCHSEPVTVSLVWESVLPAASRVTRTERNGLPLKGLGAKRTRA